MAMAKLFSFLLRTLSLISAASITLTIPVPGAAEEMMRDRPHDDHGGHSIGTAIGVGIGLGIANELMRQQAARPDNGKSPTSDKNARHKADTKKAKRATNAPAPPAKPQATELKPPATPTTPEKPVNQGTGTGTGAQTGQGTQPGQETGTGTSAQTGQGGGPEKPVAPPDQTTNTPPPADTNKTAHGHLSECPQRGKGCAALIIDFRANAKGESSHLGELVKSLKSISCDVDYVAPKFTPLTKDDDAKQINNAQMQSIKDAIARHRAKVAAGKELAIEIVQGHGHGINEFPEGAFGVFGDSDGSSTSYGITVRADRDRNAPNYGRALMSRGLFHAGNYEAANKRVCHWFVWDASCFSGETPRAVDTLNNTGTANYTAAATNVCPLHAAYSLDLAIGSSGDSATCHIPQDDKGVDKLVAAIGKFYKEQRPSDNENVNEGLDAKYHRSDVVVPSDYRPLQLDVVLKNEGDDKRSLYVDGGYRYCLGPDRDGYKFTPDPNPVRAGE